MLPRAVTNREATYVLVFVEDVECFDGCHLAGRVSERGVFARLLRHSKILWRGQAVGQMGVLLEHRSLKDLTFIHLLRGKSGVRTS